MSIYIWTTKINQSWSWLPNTYQEVEYIQSSGDQWIDTWYILTSNPKFDINFAFLWWDSNSWIPICGSRNNTGAHFSWFCCLYVNSSSYYVTPNYAWFDPWASSWVSITSGVKYNIIEDAWKFYLDWVYKSAASTTNTYVSVVGRNFLLFANNDRENWLQIRWCRMKLYWCKLYNNWTLVRNFVPCYRKSDSVIWLYDLVNNQFYTNSWTGTFTKWSDISPKWIYVWTTPVKAVYVWTTKVRPS